jgi:tetratricopeptide (TPR) repeat protein
MCLLLASILAAGYALAQVRRESPRMQQLHQALTLAKQGNSTAAMRIAQQLLEQDPKFAPAFKLKAMLLEESGRRTEAALNYEAGLKLAPNDPDFLLKVGIFKLEAGEKEEAITLLAHCARILPQDADAQFYLAQAYHLNGQDDLALKAIQQSLKADPANASILQKYGELQCSTGDYENGLRSLLKAKEVDPKLPRLDYDIGFAYYNLMNLPNAIEYSSRDVRSHLQDPNAWQLLARAQLKLQHWQQAKDSYEHILSLRPPDVDVLQGLGQCELELKNYPAAVEKLEAALRLDPTLLLARFYLSRAYAALGKTADAQREAALHRLMMEKLTFVRTIETEQRENDIKKQARQLLKENREEAALRLYLDHFKGTSATTADAYVFIGKLYLFMGQTEHGLESLHKALRLNPRVRGAHTYQGILALRDRDLATAEKEFNAEVANDPNSQSAIAELGEVRYHQGRWAEAADQIAKSHTMTPELLYLLCDSYFRLGKVQDALLTADLVAAYGRNNAPLMQGLMELLRRNGHADEAQRLMATQTP